MSQENSVRRLKAVLAVTGVIYLFYGIGFLIIPGFLVSISGEASLALGWIRWSGGPLIALGIGSFLTYRKPRGQGVFVTTSMISGLLVGLGLLYSKLFDGSTVYTWFHMTPCVINLAMSALLLWARRGAKEILE